MDYVVLGLGMGALAILLGVVAREFGPRTFRVAPDNSWDELRHQRLLGRAASGLGRWLMLVGGGLCGLTILLMLFRVGDGVGMRLTVAGVIAMLGLTGGWWGWFLWSESPRNHQSRQLAQLDRRLRRADPIESASASSQQDDSSSDVPVALNRVQRSRSDENAPASWAQAQRSDRRSTRLRDGERDAPGDAIASRTEVRPRTEQSREPLMASRSAERISR